MNCPSSEQAAAYAEGRLDAADSARYLEHCSECDECRRVLALLGQHREPQEVPAEVEARAIASLRRTLGNERDRTPKSPRRLSVSRQPQSASPLGIAVAAGVLVALASLILLGRRTPVQTAAVREMIQKTMEAPPEEPREAAPTIIRPEPVPVPTPKMASEEAPVRREVLRPEPKPEPPPGPVIEDLPRPEERKAEEPPRVPSHTVVARSLSDLQITDITGSLSVRRKGAKAKEHLAGVARLGEGDLVTAEKTASFWVEGRHPVVLTESSSISMAYVPQEQAPWLRLHSGEALVDSTGSARWVVTDGIVAVAVKPARARFAAVRGDAHLALGSLSEPLYVQPDGGDVRTLHPGQELQVGRSSEELRTIDPSVAARTNAMFEAARPRTRTIFYTSCDPTDAKREHFFVQEGTWFKNEALLSQYRDRERSAAASIAPNPRFAWRNSLTLRFRVMSNCRSVEAQMRVEDRKYTLWKVVPLDRKSREQWSVVEIPLDIPAAPQQPHWQFRRDDGGNMLTITTEDKFDSIRFVVHQSEMYSDQRPWVLVDDIQMIDRD
jgi:hypothetical protein